MRKTYSGLIILVALLVWEGLGFWGSLDFLESKLQGLGEGGAIVANVIFSHMTAVVIAILGLCIAFQGIRENREFIKSQKLSHHSALTVGHVTPIIEAPSLPTADGRLFVSTSVTPEYLAGFYKDHTDIQAGKLMQPFCGKWMKASGIVKNVSRPLDAELNPNVTIQVSKEAWLSLCFGPEWEERMAMLRYGEEVTVIGKINRGGGMIELTHCSIV